MATLITVSNGDSLYLHDVCEIHIQTKHMKTYMYSRVYANNMHVCKLTASIFSCNY